MLNMLNMQRQTPAEQETRATHASPPRLAYVVRNTLVIKDLIRSIRLTWQGRDSHDWLLNVETGCLVRANGHVMEMLFLKCLMGRAIWLT